MATFTAVKNKKQTASAMVNVMEYVTQATKTMLDGRWLVTGNNCVAQSSYLEMVTTKRRFKKTDGRQFYHFVQSFSEDRLNETINERTFTMLSQKYQQEQGELEAKIKTLTAQLDRAKEQEDSITQWIDLIKQFSSPTELTAEMLNTLIEKIVVHEATKDADGNRIQEIEIFYRFVGKID